MPLKHQRQRDPDQLVFQPGLLPSNWYGGRGQVIFYVEKLGFRVHTDVRNGDYRWLTVQHPEQPTFQLGLFKPGPPVHDLATAHTLSEIVAKGAMPPLVMVVDDCRAACKRLSGKGVEFIQEPVDRFGAVDAGFRDPSGNGWKMIEARPDSRADRSK